VSTIAHHVVLLHHFRRVLEEAASRSIDVAPIKGAHLLTSVYPEGAPRRLGDVDFLVRPGDWERALEMMPSLGFSPRVAVHEEAGTHEAGFNLDVGTGVPLLFEAHRFLFEPRRVAIDHEALWARSAASTLDGAPCRRLAVEDHVVHACLHSALHRLMQLETVLVDLEMLLDRGAPDPDRIVDRAREWRSTRACWLLLDLLARRRPDLGAGPIAQSLAPPRPARLALRLLVPGPGPTRLSGLNHRLQAALLWPWLMDDVRFLARFVSGHPVLAGARARSR
jgi:hypothetical protein